MFCIQCGQQLESDSQFCASCGAKAPAPETPSTEDSFCIQCGEKLFSDSQFCISCGAKADGNLSQIDNDAIENWLDATASVEDDNAMPVVMSPVNTALKREAPAPQKPVAKNIEEVQEDQILSGDVPSAAEPDKQRKLVMLFAGVTVALLVVVIGLVIFLVVRSRSPYPAEWGESAPYISRVVNGHLDDHRNMTVGTAFNRFFTEYEWTHRPADGIDYISIHGSILRNNEPVSAQFIFQLDDNGGIRIAALVLDSNMQDPHVINELVNYIFESAR